MLAIDLTAARPADLTLVALQDVSDRHYRRRRSAAATGLRVSTDFQAGG
jgi:hypothetical protein